MSLAGESHVFMSNGWLGDHKLITFILIYVMIAYIYNKVFRAGRLPILKEIIVYLLIAFGSFVLMIFQVDVLPIVYCLAVAIGLMLIVRIRYWRENRAKRRSSE